MALHKNAPFDDRHPAKFARSGTFAARGNPEGIGDTYWATDTEQLLVGIGTGSSDWVDVAAGGGGGGGGGAAMGAHVYRTTAQSISSGGAANIDFTNERMDTDALHDNSTNPSRITVPVGGAGVWFFALYGRMTDPGWSGSGSSSGFRIVFRKNDTSGFSSEFHAQIAVDPSNNNYYGILNAHMLITLADGDYVEVQASNNTGIATGIIAVLSVFRVGS